MLSRRDAAAVAALNLVQNGPMNRVMRPRLPIPLLVLAVAVAAMSCGDSESPTTPTPPPPPPAPSSFTLSGGVTESEPTTTKRIPGATVAFVDGTNAGKTATADAEGNYRITNVLAGASTVRASADGYQEATRPVTISADTSLIIALNPTPAMLETKRNENVSGGDTPCSDGTDREKGCKILTLDIHNPGTLEATLAWENPTTDLDLTLWRGTTLLADSRDEFSLKEVVSSSIVTGATYELRVTYYAGSVITPYTLVVKHPN
jgi:hypothetical protein